MYSDFLNDARVFIDVIKLGSISALSDKSGEHRTTISKRLSRIEDHLSVKLIKIEKGKINLTDEGTPIFFNLRHLIDDLEFKFDELSQTSSKANNHIRFLNSTDIYKSFGVPIITNILNKNPSISLEAKAYTQYQLANFGTMLKHLFNEIDVIVLAEKLLHLIDDQEWILKKRLSTIKRIYASQKYIDEHPNVRKISDISKHHCIINKYEDPNHWILKDTSNMTHKIKINVRASIDTFNFQQMLIERHLGIGLLPESVVKASPNKLQHIFTDLSGSEAVSYILVNKHSLEKKPLLDKVVREIIDEINSLDYWRTVK
ncbi:MULTISPECIES: LysR family transcriptional regulator [unclassified Francisella]|uniref:LysR family transcriptional regulator n=1 Tax=unclassified Francisella TaxID=2610885 RepID=UPI002E33B5B2|nr:MULTISPECIES: LysR family transcriptional regulator [unclassified Francisella]MED7820396.1 LysR family transcriptional regulator [Francisella sp. 19S2-4]MED7831228.1 LysR family transcriptional regulator [Francisella sp. 19S2-10]